MHCHMTHHVMNQMGHHVPNTLGMADGDGKIKQLLPTYMTMGQAGMADMGEMNMIQPANSVSMVGGHGPHDYITMGGMFTIVKIREHLPDGYGGDVGWYQDKPGEAAVVAADDVLRRNHIAADGSTAPKAPIRKIDQTSGAVPPAHPHKMAGMNTSPATQPAGKYVCPMHPEVTSDQSGDCPKCGMKLTKK